MHAYRTRNGSPGRASTESRRRRRAGCRPRTPRRRRISRGGRPWRHPSARGRVPGGNVTRRPDDSANAHHLGVRHDVGPSDDECDSTRWRANRDRRETRPRGQISSLPAARIATSATWTPKPASAPVPRCLAQLSYSSISSPAAVPSVGLSGVTLGCGALVDQTLGLRAPVIGW